MVSAIIVDLDDCLFDSRHLGKYLPERADDREGWDLFQEKMSECKINKHIMAVVDALWLLENCELIFVTGREGNEKVLFAEAVADDSEICLAIEDEEGNMYHSSSNEVQLESRMGKGKMLSSVGIIKTKGVYSFRIKGQK